MPSPAGSCAKKPLTSLEEIREAGNTLDLSRLGLKMDDLNPLTLGEGKKKVVVFATHGLLAGDLPNLNQPALAMAGKDLSDILWRVVCAGESLANAERALAWPVRSGKA